ncbi:MAG: glycosyltransferase [Thermoanaerobaculia bacterium]
MSTETILTFLLAMAVVPSIVDCGVRLCLAIAARSASEDVEGRPAGPCLVIVPARSEGEAVRSTLESLRSALRAGDEAVLLLDGADPVAARIAESLGIEVLTKEPPGPTKGAALAWLAANHRERLLSFESAMVLDTGSRLAPDFFARMRWPAGAQAVQACLTGEGGGVGEAAALSERRAQRWEDRGRVAFGWSARLRGTGMLLTPEAWLEAVPKLRTKVEDWELTLLLAAARRRIALAPADAAVFDLKPEDLDGAAAQRARWLVGQGSLFVQHWRSLVRLVVDSPFEGTAFVTELFSRPRSLSAVFRLAVATLLVLLDRSPAAIAFAGLIVATVAADVALLLKGTRATRSGVLLLAAWLRAILLLPSAFGNWLKGRHS